MPSPSWAEIRAAAALAALVLFLFRDAVFGGRVLYERDIHLVKLPQVEAFVRAIRDGSWPVWDASASFGQPLLADPSAQVLYPFTWLYLLFDPGTCGTLFVVLHLFCSGLGLYLLAKRFASSAVGALVAAVAWTASGPLLALVNVHHFAGATWMPWVVLAADVAFASPSVRATLALGLAAAGQVLAGSADMCAMTGLLVAAHALRGVRWRRPLDPGNRRIVAIGASAWFFALALTAPAWLPALDALRQSDRWSLPQDMRAVWSVHPLELVETLLPRFLNQLPLNVTTRRDLFDAREPFLLSLYLGLPAAGLVLAALAAIHKPRRVFLVAWAALGVAVALGRHAPLYAFAVRLLPPLRILRYPSKVMIAVALAWALLTGAGFDAWRDSGRRRWGLVVLAPLAVLALAAGAGALALRANAERIATLFLTSSQAPGQQVAPAVAALGSAALLASLVLLLAILQRTRAAAWPAIGVAALAAADLIRSGAGLNPTTTPALFHYRPPTVDAIVREGPARAYVYDYDIVPVKGRRHIHDPDPNIDRQLQTDPYLTRLPSRGAPVGLTQALAQQTYLLPPLGGRWGIGGSYDIDVRGLYPAWLSRLTFLLRAVEETPAHTRLLRIGGVTHVVALHEEGFDDLIRVATLPGLFVRPICVFRVPETRPRSYVVGAAHVVPEPASFGALLDPGFDPAREAILAEGDSLEGDGTAPGQCHISESRQDRVRIEARLDREGLVVLLDSYDEGWKARIDGRPAPVLRANVAFRAVRVAAGSHVIEYLYRPDALWLGLALSAAAVVTGAVALGAAARLS